MTMATPERGQTFDKSWGFARMDDGSVRVRKQTESGEVQVETRIPAEDWARIVASVSARGASEHTVTLALGFHQLGMEPGH